MHSLKRDSTAHHHPDFKVEGPKLLQACKTCPSSEQQGLYRLGLSPDLSSPPDKFSGHHSKMPGAESISVTSSYGKWANPAKLPEESPGWVYLGLRSILPPSAKRNPGHRPPLWGALTLPPVVLLYPQERYSKIPPADA